MPTCTIYVSDRDQPLIEAAKEQENNLSAAVIEGLKLFLKEKQNQREGFQTLDLKVNNHGQIVRKRFEGRRLFRFEQTENKRQEILEIFTTPKGNYVLYQRSMPIWSTASSKSGDQWTSPGTNQSVSRTMSIYPSLQDLTAQLPQALAAEVQASAQTPPIEDLDI